VLSPCFPLERGLCGPQNKSESQGEDKDFLSLPETEAYFLGGPRRILNTTTTELTKYHAYVMASFLHTFYVNVLKSLLELSIDRITGVWGENM
jgi:hypothetical protein